MIETKKIKNLPFPLLETVMSMYLRGYNHNRYNSLNVHAFTMYVTLHIMNIIVQGVYQVLAKSILSAH